MGHRPGLVIDVERVGTNGTSSHGASSGRVGMVAELRRQKLDRVYTAVTAFSVLCFGVLVVLQVTSASPFPYSDEWWLVPQAIGAQPVTGAWLWEQWVDHRIPLQKLFQVLILRAGGVDARALMFANSVLALAATIFLLSAVRAFRGRSSSGDFLFPLLLMNPGFPAFRWGFGLQFLSSSLLSICILAFLLRGERTGRNAASVPAAACALLLVLCGMNGTVSAGVISVALMAYLFSSRSAPRPAADRVAFLLLGSAVVMMGAVMIGWHPSAASGIAAPAGFVESTQALSRNFCRLIVPRSLTWPPFGKNLYYAVNGLAYICAIVLVFRRVRSDRDSGKRVGQGLVALAIVPIATLAVLAVIAFARRGYWSSGLEHHYALLATTLPLSAWIVISSEASSRVRATAGTLLVLTYGGMYWTNLDKVHNQWGSEQREQIARAREDLERGVAIDEFVKNNHPLLFYKESEDSRRWIEGFALMLKERSIEPYTSLKRNKASTDPQSQSAPQTGGTSDTQMSSHSGVQQ